MKDEDLINRIRKLVEAAGTNTAAAKKLGISRPYLRELLNGNRNPGPKVLAYFGLKRETRLVREG